MTDQHPITPPPELVKKWLNEGHHQDYCSASEHAIAQAAQWGADQELEACCKWLHWQNLATHSELIPSLRAARRPKPPSLKEQALKALHASVGLDEFPEQYDTIRRALEALDD